MNRIFCILTEKPEVTVGLLNHVLVRNLFLCASSFLTWITPLHVLARNHCDLPEILIMIEWELFESAWGSHIFSCYSRKRYLLLHMILCSVAAFCQYAFLVMKCIVCVCKKRRRFFFCYCTCWDWDFYHKMNPTIRYTHESYYL